MSGETTRTAFLFAGQGAQQVGMGKDLYEASPAVRAIYDRASEALGFDLAGVSFEGPAEELVRTDVCQPAIVAASLAALHVLRERRPDLEPVAVAGLSLGEYAALVAAGALDEAAAFKLVAARGRFMQEACDARPGAMASVLGLDPEAIEEVVAAVTSADAPVCVANYNSPRQTVISGAREAVERAIPALREKGARRVIPLEVAGAYHSPLMRPARDRLAPLLDATTFSAPRVPVYANLTARPHEGPDTFAGALASQVTSPVRWTETIAGLRAAGVEAFYELGPGSVLAGLCRQIDRRLSCASLMDLASFDAVAPVATNDEVAAR